MGFLDTLKSKFGFGNDWEDDEYYDDEQGAPVDEAHDNGFDMNSRTYTYESPYGSGASAGAVRRRPRTPDLERAQAASGTPLRSVPTGPASVTPMTPQMRIHNARPTNFEEVSEIADKFKVGTPVVLDLSQVPADQQRRYIDFASGLTYGLDGGISKVADSVFMLTPQNVEMSDADRKRFTSGRFPSSTKRSY